MRTLAVNSLLIGIIGVIAAFNGDKIDRSIFVAGYLIPVCFWFLDSIAYYYQVKIRGTMDRLREQLRERGGPSESNQDFEEDSEIIEDDRVEQSQARMTYDAFFNHSMWLYLIIVLLNTVVFLLYVAGQIG